MLQKTIACRNHEIRYDNINCKVRAAIQSLKRNKNIIINPADKGSATMILNKSGYIKEGKNQLNHHQNYQSLSLDLTKNFKLELTKLIKSFPDPYKSQLLSYIPPIPNLENVTFYPKSTNLIILADPSFLTITLLLNAYHTS